MKIAALVGSVRRDSFNQRIADYMAERYAASMQIETLDLKSLPYFDQDEEENPPETVKGFKRKISEADGVLIVTPEYNHSVPGVLKNALDWVSRVDKVMTGKPVFIVGASPGMLGTVRCQIHLRQILASPGVKANVLTGNEVFIGAVHEKIDENGRLTDEDTIQYLDKVVENYLSFSEKHEEQE
ncbi:NADPH-dependent FMN reductase [Evansella clarkii]|uniref:NADPH-dependent FMN reductase n=1 Tax=Evansella clarkii TaxID=79879 RepID=UPI000996C6D8|nr:NAD(P)H-dependent oxidoreductase [Evansella clarkii]